MGKAEDEEGLQGTAVDAQGTGGGAGRCCGGWIRVIQKWVNFRCLLILLLGVAVMLSAVFWLPLFHFGDHKDLDLDYAGYDIVASFMLRRPASFLQDRLLQLEGDIFDEMSFSSVKVEIISTDPSPAGSNVTKVVFAVGADETTQSLVRASFVTLVTLQTHLQLASSLFGTPFSFQVLKFKGGITVRPVQKVYTFQNVQILFNFTLNFSIDEILENFNELGSQLKTGLNLSPYENLYIRLTNLRGSSVDPPTTVQSQVLLAVGINPSKTRLKQLAQTITSSHAKNLGLNNSVFGRVKQVQLSSILQHSLGGDGNSQSPTPSPSPSRLPPPQGHHHHNTHLAPSHPPSMPHKHASRTGAPAPASRKHSPAAPPPCHFGYNWFPRYRNKHFHSVPSAAPPGYAPTAAPVQPKHPYSRPPKPSPFPAVNHHPSKGQIHARPPDVMPRIPPAPSPSSASTLAHTWGLPLFLLTVLLWWQQQKM